jgi:serine/threonine protein kinase
VLNDFGLSTEMQDPTELKRQNTFTGPLRWQAPELLFDPDSDTESGDDWPASGPGPASDVWAFGCTVYEVG